MHSLPMTLDHEINVDLFAGGGGASTGFEFATGRCIDVAVNHDPDAINVHKANHPSAKHYICDVFEVDPKLATGGRPVGLLWASPDCKHFSKAKGDKPVSKKIRSLAWVVVKWAKAVKPRVICLENVEEFQTWGPLGQDDRPCPERKGETFKQWVGQFETLGYKVEWRELRACDYGAPTIRKRLFLVARRDGLPIVWPEPTHAKPDVKGKGLKQWRTAADCIDWSIPCPSIFERKKPLADATCRRIAKGLMRYVIEADKPFIVSTAEANTKVVPTLIQTGYGERPGQSPRVPGLEKPLGTVVNGQKHALVSVFLAKHYTGAVGSDLADPIGTVTSVDHHSLVTASLIHMGHGEGKSGGKRFSHGVRDIEQPLNTITASGCPAGLVTSLMVKMRGQNVGSPIDSPLHTISAQGQHHALVQAFMRRFLQGAQSSSGAHEDNDFIVKINGEFWQIVDIGLRMLKPSELFKAQGFPDSYNYQRGADGSKMTNRTQVKLCGNSVSPPVAAAIISANFVQPQVLQKAA